MGKHTFESHHAIGDFLGINACVVSSWFDRFGRPAGTTEDSLKEWVKVVIDSGIASERSERVLRGWLVGKDTSDMPKLTLTLLSKEIGMPSSIVGRLDRFRKIKRIPGGQGWFMRREALIWAKLVASSCHLRLMSEHIELISAWVEKNNKWLFQKDE